MSVKYVISPISTTWATPSEVIKWTEKEKVTTTTNINKGGWHQTYWEGLVGIKHYDIAKEDRKVTVKTHQNWYKLEDLPNQIEMGVNKFYIVGSKSAILRVLAGELSTRPLIKIVARGGYCPQIAVHKHTMFGPAVAAIAYQNGRPGPWNSNPVGGKHRFRWWAFSPGDVGGSSATDFTIHPGQFATMFSTLMGTMGY